MYLYQKLRDKCVFYIVTEDIIQCIISNLNEIKRLFYLDKLTGI